LRDHCVDAELARADTRTATARVDDADVLMAGGAVRLPSGRSAQIARISGVLARAMMTSAAVTLPITYRDIAAAAPPTR
jgi:hypothetical protein